MLTKFDWEAILKFSFAFVRDVPSLWDELKSNWPQHFEVNGRPQRNNNQPGLHESKFVRLSPTQQRRGRSKSSEGLIIEFLADELLTQAPQTLSLNWVRSPRTDNILHRISDMTVLKISTIVVPNLRRKAGPHSRCGALARVLDHDFTRGEGISKTNGVTGLFPGLSYLWSVEIDLVD